MAGLRMWYLAVTVLAVSTISLRGFVPAVHAAKSNFCGTFVEPFQFLCTERRMHSADGFELLLHRIGGGTATDSNAAPVLIMHSEFLNGDSWFQFTDAADKLLPLLLVDAGFDVWIGHERATKWSHGHLSLETTDTRFWDWTWDEHAQYDVPAYLEYIKNVTGSPVHYIGMSQSATAGAATAANLRSSSGIRSMTLIGPNIYAGDSNSVVLAAWAFIFGNIIDEANYENGYQSGAFNFTTAFPGVTSINGQSPLALALEVISGPNCCLGTATASFTNGWDGTNSFKNLLHYQQGMRSNTWRRFDYISADGNTQAYGGPSAPTYHPEDISTNIPILVVYGGNDAMAPQAGVQLLLSRLRNAESVLLPNYAHFDLLWSSRRTQDIFIPILQFLERHK
ncbi:hypothetical protein R1flu_019643 [Riccia fluitans]|uniref:AB hydrolase-1 domain-containing protein n=1 Tax=Riccia fluitans TaxID=41844 RepID=A0ABD1ZKN4_9MARC